MLTAARAQSKSAPPAAETVRSNKAERQLIALNREFVTATSRLDTETSRRFCTDDFTYVSPSGAVLTKRQILNLYRSMAVGGKMPTPETLAIDEMNVRIYGDTGVIVSRATLKYAANERAAGAAVRNTAVWRKRRGNWQIVSTTDVIIRQRT